MREAARLLNDLKATGVVSDYAIFGAVAQMRYTDPVATVDVDVLVGMPDSDRIDILQPIYAACAERGLVPEGDAIRVGPWPVQFIPAHDSLTRDAMAHAETADFEGVPVRVVRADYLAVMALNVGRAKDHLRVLALLEAQSVHPEKLAVLATKYGLAEKWAAFERRFLNDGA